MTRSLQGSRAPPPRHGYIRMPEVLKGFVVKMFSQLKTCSISYFIYSDFLQYNDDDDVWLMNIVLRLKKMVVMVMIVKIEKILKIMMVVVDILIYQSGVGVSTGVHWLVGHCTHISHHTHTQSNGHPNREH